MTDLNSTLTRMKHLRDQYRHLDAESKALKEEYKALEMQVIEHLSDAEMTKAGNDLVTASMSEEELPTIDPMYWDEVREFLIENGYEDCLPRRLNSAPVKELWSMGIEIPHVTKYSRKKLSLTAVRK